MSVLSIEVHRKSNGGFRASCPELDIYCEAHSEPEAVTRMQSLILFELTKTDNDVPLGEGFTPDDNDFLEMKFLYVPPKTRVH